MNVKTLSLITQVIISVLQTIVSFKATNNSNKSSQTPPE